MNEVVSEIRRRLKQEASLETKKSSQRFFKEEVQCYGVRNPVVHGIAKDSYRSFNSEDKQEIYGVCEALFISGYNEEAIIAADWSFFAKRLHEPSDIKVFFSWIDNYISNWSSCDAFCTKTLGNFFTKFPDSIEELKSWAESENRWVRRAAAVSLVARAGRGKFLNDILDIAGILLTDPDDMVQKGYGWMLKEASKPHLKEIFNFVMENKDEMPRTALRYAIEKMPQSYKDRAMER